MRLIATDDDQRGQQLAQRHIKPPSYFLTMTQLIELRAGQSDHRLAARSDGLSLGGCTVAAYPAFLPDGGTVMTNKIPSHITRKVTALQA